MGNISVKRSVKLEERIQYHWKGSECGEIARVGEREQGMGGGGAVEEKDN